MSLEIRGFLFNGQRLLSLALVFCRFNSRCTVWIVDEKKMYYPKMSPIERDYEISNVMLGRGVSGEVYQCTHRETRKNYAVKVKRFS